jgi:hypothetical protein
MADPGRASRAPDGLLDYMQLTMNGPNEFADAKRDRQYLRPYSELTSPPQEPLSPAPEQ